MTAVDKIHCKLLLRCDMQCPFCFFKGKNTLFSDISFSTLKNKFNQLAKEGSIGDKTSFVLSGGEPLLYPELREVISYILKNYKGFIKIKTNLKKFNRLERILKLFEPWKGRIEIIADCHFESKTKEEKIYFLQNIRLIEKLNYKVKIIYTIPSGVFFNEKEILDNVDFLKPFGKNYKLNPIRFKKILDNTSTINYTDSQKLFLLKIDDKIFKRDDISSSLKILTIE